ncbi:MAG: flagellar brake protein [Gammaproteobacteria bacterium]
MTGDAAPVGAGPEDLRGVLLRSRARIDALLHRLRLQHALLSVRPHASPRWHLSMVVGVDGAHDRLDLDALHPPPQPAVETGTLLHVRGRVDGGELRFECSSLGASVVDGRPALRTTTPDEVFVLERRSAFRLRLPEQMSLPPSAVGREHAAEQPARLIDVSCLGAGAVVPEAVGPQAGEALRMRVILPGAVIDAQAQVRSTARHGQGVRVGLRFDGLRSDDESRLAQAVNRLERQLIRAGRRGT